MQGVQHFRSLMLNVKLRFYFQHFSCYADIKYLGFFFVVEYRYVMAAFILVKVQLLFLLSVQMTTMT